MKQISAAEAIELLKKGDNAKPLLTGYTITEPLAITEPFNSQPISDCKFQSVSITANAAISFSFNGCAFANGLELDGVTNDYFGVSSCTMGGTLTIKNCNILTLHIKGGTTNIHEVDFRGTKILHELMIRNVNHVSFDSKSSVEDRFLISERCGSLYFDGKFKQLEMGKCTPIKESIKAHFVGTFNSIKVVRCKRVELHFDKLDADETSLILNKESSLFFDSGKMKDVTIEGGHYLLMKFVAQTDIKLRVIKAKDSDAEKEKVSKEAQIDNLDLAAFIANEKNKLHFNNVDFRKVNLDSFDNYGFFQVNGSKIRDEILLTNTILRDANFNDVEFLKTCTINIRDSYLLKTTFTNVRWPSDYKIYPINNSPISDLDPAELKKLRESYRQLKLNYISSGNKFEALEFQKHEYDIHYEITKKDLGKNWRSWTLIGNFLIMWTHKYASVFSQSVLKPFAFLLGGHLVLFFFFLKVHSLGVEFGLDHPTCDAFWKGFGLYWTTMFPTHPFDIISFYSNQKVNIMGGLDTLMRIWSAYFIFYFISASRKYHL
ncbi:hypothetical protein [Chryseolinea soli]|uniref:Pentapeptide repeat-containing protein n=1 Tax=Chryseolinea soli TaxID=2321403 RepID=A0A385SYZ3_9BACT|nr:hypothetical protein [Chryseolinea soli]AYB35305.1 hypothetical protein D4L85_34065 [Chryseolinea soli]